MRLEWIFLMQLVLGIFMIFFLRKLMEMKKQVDEITREVTNYLAYITEEVTPEEETTTFKPKDREENEDVQNRLIQAVLGEYFP